MVKQERQKVMDTVEQSAQIAKEEAEAIRLDIAERIQARRKSNADMRKNEFIVEIGILLQLEEHYTKIAQIMSGGGSHYNDHGEEAPCADDTTDENKEGSIDEDKEAPCADDTDEKIRRRMDTNRKSSRSVQKGVQNLQK